MASITAIFGIIIKESRERLGFSQHDLAMRAGLNVMALA